MLYQPFFPLSNYLKEVLQLFLIASLNRTSEILFLLFMTYSWEAGRGGICQVKPASLSFASLLNCAKEIPPLTEQRQGRGEHGMELLRWGEMGSG